MFFRSYLIWTIAFVVLLAGMLLGIRSARRELAQAVRPPLATPTTTDVSGPSRQPTPTPRPAPRGFVGAIVKIELQPRQLLVVRLRDGREVNVYLVRNIQLKQGRTNIRLRDLVIGDQVTIIGKRRSDNLGIDASAITVAPRPSRPAEQERQ